VVGRGIPPRPTARFPVFEIIVIGSNSEALSDDMVGHPVGPVDDEASASPAWTGRARSTRRTP